MFALVLFGVALIGALGCTAGAYARTRPRRAALSAIVFLLALGVAGVGMLITTYSANLQGVRTGASFAALALVAFFLGTLGWVVTARLRYAVVVSLLLIAPYVVMFPFVLFTAACAIAGDCI